MQRFVCSAVLLGFLLAPFRAAEAQSIEFVSTLDAYSCYIPDTSPATVYIVAKTWDGEGVQGAEFAVKGFPTDASSGYIVTTEPSPLAFVALGDPIRGGANIAFPTCQTEAVVLLYTVTVVKISEDAPYFTGTVDRHSAPSNLNFQCPLINRCDAPVFTAVCVYGGYTSQGPRIPIPSNPSPANNAEDVSITPSLSAVYTGEYLCCEPVSAYPYKAIYFGTEADPPLVEQAYPGTPPTRNHPYLPGSLHPDTQYYWRIVWAPPDACVSASSPVWSFRTTPSVDVEQVGWDAVKKRYRE